MTDTEPSSGRTACVFHHGTLILPDRTVDDGVVVCEGGRIAAAGTRAAVPLPAGAAIVDAAGGYIALI